jgi:hypothetical protein
MLVTIGLPRPDGALPGWPVAFGADGPVIRATTIEYGVGKLRVEVGLL